MSDIGWIAVAVGGALVWFAWRFALFVVRKFERRIEALEDFRRDVGVDCHVCHRRQSEIEEAWQKIRAAVVRTPEPTKWLWRPPKKESSDG